MKNFKIHSLKYLFLFGLLSITILTTGCVKFTYNFEIDNYNNIKLTEINAINVKIANTVDAVSVARLENDLQSKINALILEEYSAEKYTDKNFTGLKSYKEFKLDHFFNESLPAGFSNENQTETPVKIDKTFFKTTYTISLKFKAADINKRTSDIPQVNIAAITSFNKRLARAQAQKTDTETTPDQSGVSPVMELTIKIPTTASSNNATEVLDNHIYKWDLASKKAVEINLQYTKLNWFNILLTLFVLFIISLVVIATKEKDTDKDVPKL